MTPKQLLSLDALLGREVMGYNVQPLANFLVGSMRDDGYNYCTVNEHGDPGVLPAFTTSLDAAMLLVERVEQRGAVEFGMELQRKDGSWWAVFIMSTNDWPCAEAKTPALAVSLAVCEACGVKIEME